MLQDFTWILRWNIVVITWATLLYTLTFKIAWFQAAFLVFKIDKCPKEPKFKSEDKALVCYQIAAFMVLCIDYVRLQGHKLPL